MMVSANFRVGGEIVCSLDGFWSMSSQVSSNARTITAEDGDIFQVFANFIAYYFCKSILQFMVTSRRRDKYSPHCMTIFVEA
jgi:hypothetical protein